jgi:nodulation protein A
VQVVSRWETALTEDDHTALAALLRSAFTGDAEQYATKSWPTGWARKEARLWLADEAGRPVAHLSVERRLVAVDGVEVLVAGIGEVAVAADRHGQGLGAELMRALEPRLRGEFAAEFGFVQCAEDVVGFYRRSGWTPVGNVVRHLDVGDQRTVRDSTTPTLVRAGRRPVTDWPEGLVDLRGLPW